MNPMRGPGRFQWNAAGWIGAQLGATCWLAPLAILLFLKKDAVGALLIATAFGAVNVLGLFLWLRRDRIPPYPAIQTLLGGCALAALATLFFVITSPVMQRDVLAGWKPWNALFSLSVFPGLMVMFHFLERESRERTTSASGASRDGEDPGNSARP